MGQRVAQIMGLVFCILGWVFVGCTFVMGRWREAQLGGQGGSSVVLAAWFYSDLWKDCYEDSTAVINCVDLGLLWAVKSYIQAVRGLLLTGLCLGLIGAVLTFSGMECTQIGGDKRNKDRTLLTAASFHLVGSVSATAGYCVYINTVVAAYLHSKADPTKLSYEAGPPLFLGLVACILILIGCSVHYVTVCRDNQESRHVFVPFIRERDISSKKSSISQYKMASVVIV
ncbi:claudin-10-like isoform 1-T2 [Pholidichthys leucotaenia]